MLLARSSFDILLSLAIIRPYPIPIVLVPDAPPQPPSCRPNKVFDREIDSIVMLHMRKAGGTSLKSFLHKVGRKHKVKVNVTEAPFVPPDPEVQGNTLYITHIREPVARAISHYKYEGRWRCRKLTREGFIPSLNNTRMSLEDFTNERLNKKDSGPLWTCASNCYARWSTGLWKSNHREWIDNSSSTSRLWSAARHKLWSYNLIIVNEWLKNEDYVRSLERIFDTPGISRRARVYCDKASKAANAKFPLQVSVGERDSLKERNVVDSGLYDELVSCQPAFSERKISWKVWSE